MCWRPNFYNYKFFLNYFFLFIYFKQYKKGEGLFVLEDNTYGNYLWELIFFFKFLFLKLKDSWG